MNTEIERQEDVGHQACFAKIYYLKRRPQPRTTAATATRTRMYIKSQPGVKAGFSGACECLTDRKRLRLKQNNQH